MKRSMILLAAVFAMASTSVLAEKSAADKADAANSKAVVLSDAELDNITAGSATVEMVLYNSGSASVLKGDLVQGASFHCVNCTDNPFAGQPAKYMVIQNPSHTVFKCRGAAAGFPGC